jgi:ectoine hydroxylase-related dioxygenase (phytanoyl-CoA dioxygenase family)
MLRLQTTGYRTGWAEDFCAADKIAEMAALIESLMTPSHSGSQPSGVEVSVRGYGTKWTFLENLCRRSERLQRWLLEEEPARLAQTVMETTDLWLLRDQTYFKEPGSEHTPWHQDAIFIPVDGCEFLTIWIPLTPVCQQQDAPLDYWLSPHPATHWLAGGSDKQQFDQLPNTWSTEGWHQQSTQGLNPGSCSFHSGWTVHGSGPHTAPSTRKAFVVVYGRGEGELSLQPPMGGCPPELRDQVWLLRAVLRDSCFAGLDEGDPVPCFQQPWVRL